MYRPRLSQQHGFTLLEALITIVIISIGLLGLLKLQSVALVDTQTSAARSQATIAADNMADRIRANPLGASQNAYVQAAAPSNEPTQSPSDCTDGHVCKPAQMAVFDTREWRQTLAQTLPAGSGSIVCSLPTGSASQCEQYTITVAWHERTQHSGSADSNSSDPTVCNADANVIERCFKTVVRP